MQAADGGYVFVGRTLSFGAGDGDLYMVMTNAHGDTVRTRTFGGSSGDGGYSVARTADGGYIITGYTYSVGNGAADVWLVKTDSSGDTLWTKAYGGGNYDFGYSVVQTDDGGYAITGYTESFGTGDQDIWFLRTTALGDTVWTRTFGGVGFDLGRSIAQTADGGYVIAASTYYPGTINTDALLIRTDADGDTLWTRTFGGSDSKSGHSVVQTADGGYVMAGLAALENLSPDVWLIRTDASGHTLWTRTFGGQDIEYGHSVAQTADGGYVVAGETWSYGAGYADAWLIRTDSKGNTVWTRTFGGEHDDGGNSVAQASDGGYIVVGISESAGPGTTDAWLIKTDSLGRVGMAETQEPERTEPLVPTMLTRARLQAELLDEPSLALFDALGRKVHNLQSGVLFIRTPTSTRKVLVTD